jgi:hypothetical protein
LDARGRHRFQDYRCHHVAKMLNIVGWFDKHRPAAK